MNGPDDFIAEHSDEQFMQLIQNATEFAELPKITLRPGESPQAVNEAEKVLIRNSEGLRIFQRAGELVRIVTLRKPDTQGGLRREPGTEMLIPLSSVTLTEIFEQYIIWQRKKHTETLRVDCPKKIAEAYRSRVGSWQLPPLAGTISAPIMRPDGSVLCRAGYDAETGLYLTEDWPGLGGSPCRGDAMAALGVLLKPFSQFPFVSKEDKSVLVSAILTVLQRRLLQSAPLFGFSAPTPRTGKSLLAEAVAIIANGRPAPAMAVSSDREETRKAVVAALREGYGIVNLDNIEYPLGSADLSRALTQPEYQDRLLGESRMLQLPTNITWTATGNNLSFKGDLSVRVVICRLDSQMEQPEGRSFEIPNLKAYITEHRRELVTAALLILRAYVLAGRPDQKLTPWGGFDEWSATIRAPLVWLGMGDPCVTRKHVIEDDPEREQAVALLGAWYSAVGDGALRSSQIVKRANTDEELKTALLAVASERDNPNNIDPRRIGHFCRDWEDRVVSGFALRRCGKVHHAETWKVERIEIGELGEFRGVKIPSQETEKSPDISASADFEQIHQTPMDSPELPNSPTLSFGADGAGGSADDDAPFDEAVLDSPISRGNEANLHLAQEERSGGPSSAESADLFGQAGKSLSAKSLMKPEEQENFKL